MFSTGPVANTDDAVNSAMHFTVLGAAQQSGENKSKSTDRTFLFFSRNEAAFHRLSLSKD
jgi:hypothetical protein